MASPFKVFRKNQKILLVIAGLMAMIAFVVLPSVLQTLGSRQGSIQDPVVVTTAKYGNLTQSALSNLQARHQRVIGILAAIISRVNPRIDYQRLVEVLQYELGGSKESEAVERWLIAHKASEIGIDVGDDAIRDFIKERTGGKLPVKDLLDILKQHAGDRYTDAMFFDDLREELKVVQFRQMFEVSISGVPPAERWDYYLRAHQQAEIQCIPVAVRDFVGTVSKPDDEKVLKDFFDKYKDRVASPDSPEPGFRVPQKVALEYFVANLDKFAAPDKVTEEEIQTYYEKDSKKYDELNKTILFNQTEKNAEKKDSEKKDGENKEPAAKDKAAEGQKPAEETKPAETAQPAPAEGEKKEGEPKEGEKKSEPAAPSNNAKPAETPAANPTDKPADSADGKTSSIERSPYRMVSLAADDNKENPEPPKADAPKAEPPKPDAPAADVPKADAPAPSADAAPTKQEPAAIESKPADAAPAESKPNEAAPGTPAAQQPPPAEGQKPETPVRHTTEWVRQLTEETRQVIRKAVAKDKIRAIFQKLEPQMKENAMEWKRYEAAKLHEETGLQKPSRLDFAALANEYGIESGSMPDKTYWEARETEIGKANLYVDWDRDQQGYPILVYLYDLAPGKPAEISSHTPFVAREGSDFFLAWKSSDIKESAPKWDNPAVKQQVLDAWKLEQARKPAKEKAEALAKQAKEAKAPLKDVFATVPDVKVITPTAFAWLTPSLNPMNPQYRPTTEVTGVEFPGDEFMKTVFALNPMDVGTAMNAPKSMAYVVQVQKFEPGNDTLWQRFLDDEYPRYRSAGDEDRQAAQLALRSELEKEAGLKWERKADQPQKDKDEKDKDESSGD